MQLPHQAGGFLEHARSPLVPFCHAVLIAPDVVVTAARCVDDGWWELSFGVGEVGGEMIAVDEAMLHPFAADGPGHALVALRLEHPVRGVVPAIAMVPEEVPCGVEIPSYDVVLRGEEGTRHIWTACGLEPATGEEGNLFVAMDGYPNCHGDSGAGAFDAREDGDHIIGWVTGAGHLGAPHPIDEICVTDVELASAADNMDFLTAALALSHVPGGVVD